MAVVADHRPYFAMLPGRALGGVFEDQLPSSIPSRLRPRTLRRITSTLVGLPASPGAFGHVDQLAEPRGRHARLNTDHLEVLEGRNLPSADFFHTLISIAASPRAWVSSETSASSCCSRLEGPDRPAVNAVLPASRKSAFHRPIDCSDTLSRRAASATVISPANTLNTIRVFFSAGITGGLPMIQILLQDLHNCPARNLDARRHHPQPARDWRVQAATTPSNVKSHLACLMCKIVDMAEITLSYLGQAVYGTSNAFLNQFMQQS